VAQVSWISDMDQL